MKLFAMAFFITSITVTTVHALDMSGKMSAELLSSLQSAEYQTDNNQQFSMLLESEFKTYFRGGDNLTFTPFFRIDYENEDRQHFDVRELSWLYVGDNWDIRLGISKVFWGVLESRHLVDVINQSDILENYSGEEKLGQPMAGARLFSDYGTFEAYILPYFREREFNANDSRFSGGFDFNGKADYKFGADKQHVDTALRWSHNVGDWDIGLAWFHGTGREPILTFTSPSEITPTYVLIDQQSMDVQYIQGEWMYKAEMISRDQLNQRYFAYGLGFERTFVRILNSNFNIGWLLEYHNDDRKLKATTAFQNDVFIGFRLSANDVNDMKGLLGIGWDLEQSSRFLKFEASRRINENILFTIDAHLFDSDVVDPLLLLDRADYVSMSLNFYF